MYPDYLNLSKKQLDQRIEKFFKILENCEICPKKCHRNRLASEKGFCQLGSLPMVSAHHPHFGEESVLVGNYGSGTIFFCSCNLACVFCQNYEISQLRIGSPSQVLPSKIWEGKEISLKRLAEMMIELQNLGCHNINFVTPTSQVPQIVKALAIAIEKGLKLPLVYNTNAYDSVEVLKLLDGIIDIYMPDAKYSDNKIALKYSSALYPPKFSKGKLRRAGYFEIMKAAIKEMHRQVGDLIINKGGIAVRGLLIRHLVLPNRLAGSEKILEFIAKEISKKSFVNILSQYWPAWKAREFPELNRRIMENELEEVINYARKIGLTNFIF